MARPRSFDEEAALDAATGLFWQNGLASTSVRDLSAAMGLGLPSLYNAFGDKHALFTRCLDRYLEGSMRARMRRLEGTSGPRDAIETFLNEIVTRSLADPRGCFLVNSALEVAPHDAQLRAAIAARLDELESFFLRMLHDGQADGSIARGRPAADLARLLVATVMGLRVLSRLRPEAEVLRGAARQVLAALDPAAEEGR
ncbi:TetR/AcrR family transcriptional regulator [Falsiroseomonas sp.]|uniref:TetR/AcrR family transcriptional regulator n=1 Tax=Falsiroseomonas sp. TaxID=2870721 RepID=UPI0034A573C9